MKKIIVLSGWANPKESLDALSRELLSSFDVTTVSIHDLQSASDSRKDSVGLSGYAAGLINLVEQINEPCVVAGWSAGGIAVLEAACACQHLIKGLILISSTSKFCSDADYRFGKPLKTVHAMAQGLRKNARKVLAGFFENSALPHIEEAASIRSSIDSAEAFGIDELLDGLEYLQKADVRGMLAGLDIPALILHGGEDKIIPWEAGQYAANKMQKSIWVLKDGAGHDLPLRHPGFIAERAADFIGKLSA